MDPDIHVDVLYRDSVFKRLKTIAENQFCIDCSLKNPSWCSVILGVFICYNCATPHRSLGTHLSFVRSSELDMWTLRQLAYLENGGNKKAKNFFRTHGVSGSIDYRSQLAERWRNELSEIVTEIYPAKNKEEYKEKVEKIEEIKEAKKVEEVVVKEDVKVEKISEEKEVVVKPVVARNAFKVPAGEAKHKFRKSKVEDAQPAVAFKPVCFKAQTEEEEFFDPQPLKPPPRPKAEIVPTPAPAVIQRKPVEKKAISSEDYEAQYTDERATKSRISQFSSASSISSDMYFGRESPKTTELNVDKIKEEASRIGAIALDKASKLKTSLSGAINNLQSRFNSYN